MKKITYLIYLIVCLFLLSCGEEKKELQVFYEKVMNVGETQNIVTSEAVTIIAKDTSIIEIKEKEIKAIKPGKTSFQIEYLGEILEYNIEIKNKYNAIEKIILVCEDNMLIGSTQTLTINGEPIGASIENLYIETSNDVLSVELINNEYKISALKKGTCCIKVYSNNVYSEIDINVIDNSILSEDIVLKSKTELEVGETIDLSVEILPVNASNKEYIVEIIGDALTLNGNTINANSEGEAILKITSKDLNVSKDFKVTIIDTNAALDRISNYVQITDCLSLDSIDITKYNVTFDEEFFTKEENSLKPKKKGRTFISVNNVSKEIVIYGISIEEISSYLYALYDERLIDGNIELVSEYYNSGIKFNYQSENEKILSIDGKVTPQTLDKRLELMIYYMYEGEEIWEFIPVVVKGWGKEIDVIDKYLIDKIPASSKRNVSLPSKHPDFDCNFTWYVDGERIDNYIFSFERTNGANYYKTLTCIIESEGETYTREFSLKCIMLESQAKTQTVFKQYKDLYEDMVVTSDIELKTQDDLYDSRVSWYSYNAYVLSDSGKYTKPFNSINVKFMLTVEIGEYEYSGLVTIYVKGEDLDSEEEKWSSIESFLDRIHKEEIITHRYYLFGCEKGYEQVVTRNIGYLPFYEHGDLKVTEHILPSTSLLKPGRNRSSTNYITLHNTGMADPSATAKGLDEYIHTTDREASWHFSVDDYEAYQELGLNEIGWHAGDGSYSYGSIHNDDYGPLIGGGNNNSIGIEMCVYSGCDFNMVMRNTAKLVSKLLVIYKLTPSDIRQHYDFSRKNCPQVIREAGRWSEMLELINIEYYGRTRLSDVTFEFVSLTPEYLDNKGRIIKNPNNNATISYKVIVTNNNIKKEYTYNSVLLPTK